MADEAQRLAVLIEANTKAYENAMKRVERTTRAAMREAGASSKKLETQIKNLEKQANAMAPRLGRVGQALVAGLSLGAAVRFADGYQRVENALKITGLAGTELVKVQDKLYDMAVKNFAPVEALANLYSKATLVQKELGVSTEDLLKFTNNVAVALRVSGKSASESAGALMQLSQALGSGTVRAEEFNSILEGAPTIAMAVAAGLKEAGGSTAKLRQLMLDGKISSQAFFKAFEGGAPLLEEMGKDTVPTISEAFTNMGTSIQKMVGEMSEATGIGEALTKVFQNLAENLAKVDMKAALAVPSQTNASVMEFIRRQAGMAKWALGMETDVRKSMGLGPYAPAKRLPNDGVPDGFTFGATNRGGPKIKQVSVNDFAAPGAGGGSGGRVAAIETETDRVEQLRGAYSSASEIIDQFAERQAEATDRQRELADGFSTFAQGMVADLRAGVSAADALNNALNRVLDSMLSTSLDGLSSALAGAFIRQPGTALPGITGHAMGPRALGGPVGPNRPYLVGERGPELFVPSTAGAVHAGRGSGATMEVNINNYGNEQVTQTRRSSGNREIVDIMIGEVGKAVAGGKLDKPMSSRYGATPKRMQG